MDNSYYDGDECLRRMQMVADNEEILGFFKCNVYKYIYRCTKKNDNLDAAKKDLGKAASYLAELNVRVFYSPYDEVLAMLYRAMGVDTWGALMDARHELLVRMEREFRWG